MWAHSCDVAGVVVVGVHGLRVAVGDVEQPDVGVAAGCQVHLVCADLNLVDLQVQSASGSRQQAVGTG